MTGSARIECAPEIAADRAARNTLIAERAAGNRWRLLAEESLHLIQLGVR